MCLVHKRERLAAAAFCLLVFLCLLLFFTLLHPIPVMDGDDMVYIIKPRPAIPIPSSWNPARVLPETLMPLCGNLAGLLASLDLGSFIDCQVFVLAAMLSAFITLYVWALRRLLLRRFALPRPAADGLAVLFLLLHFLVFRSEKAGNLHLFHTYDACCVFFYTIPALLSCTLVLLLMAEEMPEGLFTAAQPVRGALWLTGLYFAIFSNLFSSAVLAIYASLRFLGAAGRRNRRQLLFFAAPVLLWLAALALEAFGGRAGSLSGNSRHVLDNLRPARDAFLSLLQRTSPLFRLMAAALPLGLLLILLLRRRAETGPFFALAGTVLLCLIPALLFHLLLAAAATHYYAGRPEAAFPLLCLVFLLLILCAAQLLRQASRLALLLPLVLIVVLSMTNTEGRTFADSNPMDLNGILLQEIENDIGEQILAAARGGRDEVSVEVLRSADDWANWPHNPAIGNAFSSIFLKFGLIGRPVSVTVVPSDAYNARFGVPLP